MTRALIVEDMGPAVSIQDLGRPGYLAKGLTRGGALDRLAIHEGAALLQRPPQAAIEMIGFGGVFRVTEDTRIALTGGVMQAAIDGTPISWNASHMLAAGARLTLGGVLQGAVGYVHVGGGFDLPEIMGALSTHRAAGIGHPIRPGKAIPLHPDTETRVNWHLPAADRLNGGRIHIVRSLQTEIFGDETLARFEATSFARDARANRQGIRFNPDGPSFAADGGLSVVSEIIAPGDIQITGDGAPYVLMCESQTTGGYPRIATVLPSDLPRVAQAPLGAQCQFVVLDRKDALDRERRAAAQTKSLSSQCQPLIRNPADMTGLLGYNLISGVADALTDPTQGDSS